MKKPFNPGGSYTEVKTYPKKPRLRDLKKEWYVYFNYLHEGGWRPIRRKGGINEADNFTDKLDELMSLKAALEIAMDRGWNPILKVYEQKLHEDYSEVFDPNLSLIDAIDFALKNCDVARSTKNNYRNCIKKIKQAIYHLSFDYLLISEVKRKHIKVILQKAKEIYKWTNNEYNKNLGYLQGVLSRLEEFEIVDYNPAHKIKYLEEYEMAPKYIPYTDEEKKKIADHFFYNLYGAYVYLETRYHTGMRPFEALALKISDIDEDLSTISITPDRKRHNSKTKKCRIIQINRHLSPLLREWIKDAPSKDCYVFGSPYEPGKGNRGSSTSGRGVWHPDYFKPSLTRIKRDTVTRMWKSVVIDTLGINKYQYASKHTATDDMLKAGISLQAIQEMYGHSTEFMTMRYQTVLKEMHRKEIDEKAPSFVK
jgi:integrase